MMKKLRQLLMAILMCGVVSVGAFAQKQDPPPKKNPPHPIKPEPKNPPPDKKKP